MKKELLSKISKKINSESVSEYIVDDIVIPRLRDLGWDIFDGCIDILKDLGEQMIFGEVTHQSRNRNGVIQYSSASRKARNSIANRKKISAFDNVIDGFESRQDASEILNELQESIDDYGCASVADFKSLIGEIPKTGDFFTGWFDLRSATVKKGRNGWEIKLPSIKNIKE